MKTDSKEKLMDNDAPPPTYSSTESSAEKLPKVEEDEKPPSYSEYPPRPQMGTEHVIDLPEDRNAVDELGRPIHCYRGGAHDWEESYASWGICLAICCFPCGIYCCHKLKDAKCKKCGYVFEAFPDKETPPDPVGERNRRIGFAVGYLSGIL